MTTIALILAFWLAAGVAVMVAFSWLKRDDRRRAQVERRLACARNRHDTLRPGKLVCDCGAISRNRVPWLDRDEEFWTDDEDEA